MSKTTRIIVALVVVALVAGGAVLLSNNKQPTDTTSSASTTNTKKSSATIMYDENGFSPAEVTVASGSTVTFVNKTQDTIEPSSGPHPTHADNPQLNMGDIEAGQSKTATLTAK